MKKKSIYLLLIAVLLFPFVTFAKESKYLGETYQTLNFEETLETENIEKVYESYKETDDQITIYMFRGNGCGFCQSFLNFLNNNTNEYGKYFKLVSFEVWGDQKNSELMNQVGTFLNQQANGVPFIVIGEEAFLGFDEEAYGESIKTAIKNLYDTPAKKRYDVFKEMKKNPEKWKNKDSSSSDTNTVGSKYSTLIIVLSDFIFTLIATVVVLFFINKKLNGYKRKVESPREEKKEEKPKKKK